MTMLLDAESGLWVGTTKGLYYFAGDQRQRWGVEDGLPNPQVSALMQDRKNLVWVGTGFHDQGGTILFKKESGSWTLEKTLPNSLLAAPKTRSMFQDANDNIWLGSETAGLSIISKDQSLRKITQNNGLPGREVTIIKQASNKGVWLGTLKGLIHVEMPLKMPLTLLNRID